MKTQITENLSRFGLTDIIMSEAKLVKHGQEKNVSLIEPVAISDLMHRLYEGLPVFKDEPLGLMGEVKVYREGEVLGEIFDNTFFPFGMDVKSTLGWFLATSTGKYRPVPIDIEQLASELKMIVRHGGVRKDNFFGAWMDKLREICHWGNDAHCPICTPLWEAATREVMGIPHKGYPFMW